MKLLSLFLATSALGISPSLALDLLKSPGELPPALTDWSLGEVFFPSLHLHATGGFASDEAAELASGAHDPVRSQISAQALEPSLSLRTKYVEGFANAIVFQDGEGDWESEMEEYFGKIVNIPGGFELKGGQFLPHFGELNDKHLHAWDFVDSELAYGRFLGEHGLLLQGGELSWTLPFRLDPGFVSIASVGFGNALADEHAHEDEHEDEAIHEGEEAILADDIAVARLTGRYRHSDFHTITGGISWAGGTNGFDRQSNIWAFDAEYLWRENGLEPGGRALRWRNELFWRDVNAYSEHLDENEVFSGSYSEWGFHSLVTYTWNQNLDTGLRFGWLEGIDDFGQDERFRISPAVTWWFDTDRRIGLRSQYNFDAVSGASDEHSLWFQLNIALGSTNEVR